MSQGILVRFAEEEFEDMSRFNDYFDKDLPTRKVPGMVRFRGGRGCKIRKNGIDVGDIAFFSYKARIRRIARILRGRTDILDPVYRHYFVVDCHTISNVDRSVKELAELGNFTVGQQSWPRFPLSKEVLQYVRDLVGDFEYDGLVNSPGLLEDFDESFEKHHLTCDRLTERAAIRHVKLWYKKRRWRVKSLERSRTCGYDLKCTKESEEEHAEIKGCAGSIPLFVITAGELKTAKEDPMFRLHVVVDAKSAPRMFSYTAKQLLDQFDLTPLAYRATMRKP